MELISRRTFLLATAVFPVAAAAQTPAPSDAYLYIIWPNDGQRIKGAFWCRFGLRNMGVTRAGDKAPNVGHHHLLVDVDEPLKPNEPIPTGRNYLHFGAGQTEARLDLPPGPHTLQLVLGDADHKPFDPIVISKKIRITVVGATPQVSARDR
ncbi:DUF4399 domain-containing protein [Microvirga massiliensis]|uniref:DUF4399 domain-containing protein n=1 Tax=Microvirga massiliensis TaxID=1033741 RepID=UPI00062B839D|nr:DUF4399 domain-containing protein [Microvirga massiliensis]